MLASESAPSGRDERFNPGASDRPPLRIVRCDDPHGQVPHLPQSPSLQLRRDNPAHEMKLLVDEERAKELEQRLQGQMSLDPHANLLSGNCYGLSTLYCDTPGLDVFHRQGRYRLFKFRLRQYGDAEVVYLERKSKRGMQVRKRRTVVGLDEIQRFQTVPHGKNWEGAWYHAQLVRNRFQPKCLLHYERVAYFGQGDGHPMRLTFDRRITGGLASDWTFARPVTMKPLLQGFVVCELKYRGPLPTLFKSVIEAMQLLPVGVSKYRHCLQAAGIEPKGALPNA